MFASTEKSGSHFKMETVIIGFIVIKEVTSTAIALYNGTGILNDGLKRYRENQLSTQIQLDKDNADELQLDWEDLRTRQVVKIPVMLSLPTSSVESEENEWTAV